jgi:hypothetical protein
MRASRVVRGRVAALLLLVSMGLSACAHDHALDRQDIAAMQNDSPAISPWLGPAPDEVIQHGF